ncbi:MAG: glycerate kinase [Candidatus Omnitrophota bacterium]
MKIIIAPDSFKGSLSAITAAKIIKKGFLRSFPRAKYSLLPISDGGEGLVDVLLSGIGGKRLSGNVSDPLGRPMKASYGVLPDGKTAVLEMASASGLTLLKPEERNPLKASTYGTGQLIADALKRNVKRLIIGIGGSATSDGGTGMARALGIKFLDRKGKEIPDGGGGLKRLARIDVSGLEPAIKKVEILVAADVNNLLLGKEGAACVYGPQKGADPEQVKVLEAGLSNLARVIAKDLGKEISSLPAGGAAGGLGAGLYAFLGARIKRGIELVLDLVEFPEKVKAADLIITGEGRIDFQVKFGKALLGVAKAGKNLNIPVVAFCGSRTPEAEELRRYGITAIFPILPGPCTLKEAMDKAEEFLLAASAEVASLLKTICHSER